MIVEMKLLNKMNFVMMEIHLNLMDVFNVNSLVIQIVKFVNLENVNYVIVDILFKMENVKLFVVMEL